MKSILNLLQPIRSFLNSFASEFRPALIGFLIVLILSVLLLAVTTENQSIYNLLSDSRQTPWGVVTSIFVHSGSVHLASNVTALFTYVVLFVLVQGSLTPSDKKRRSQFLLLDIFISGILANILFLLVSTGSAAGASGVVYASEGVVTGFALFTAFPNRLTSEGLREHLLSKRQRSRGLPGLVIFIVLFLEATLFPRVFLNVEPGVNAFAHFWAFEISFISVMLFVLYRWKKTGKFNEWAERDNSVSTG